MSFADQVIAFNKALSFQGKLPKGIRIMNPFAENKYAMEASSLFYEKYYSDEKSRKLILGINPGRLGAGVTGIPFTDTKRLTSECAITIPEISTHELSSVFVYDMITAFGGPKKFYQDYYINSISPLGYVIADKKGKEKNYNYYDSPDLLKKVESFMINSLEKQLEFGIDRDICFCLGTGKNFKYLEKLNNVKGYFKEVVPLEHPRYVMQYKLKSKEVYIEKYLSCLDFRS